MANGMVFPRMVLTNELSYCGKRALTLRRKQVGAGTIGPAVASRCSLIELITLRFQPGSDQFALRKTENTISRVNVGHQTNAMGDPTASGGTRPQCSGGLQSAGSGYHIGGVWAGGWLSGTTGGVTI